MYTKYLLTEVHISSPSGLLVTAAKP